MNVQEVKLLDGRVITVKVEDGFEIVKGGKIMAGDKTYMPPQDIFTDALESDIGADVDDFWCVIRRINKEILKEEPASKKKVNEVTLLNGNKVLVDMETCMEVDRDKWSSRCPECDCMMTKYEKFPDYVYGGGWGKLRCMSCGHVFDYHDGVTG
jgi:hypothetical protein